MSKLKLVTDPRLEDEQPVKLTPDQLALIKDQVSEIRGILTFLEPLVKENNLTVATRTMSTECLESFVGILVEATGQNSTIRDEQRRRSADVREANIEIRELKKLIGSTRGLDGVADSLSACREDFYKYWDELGFSNVSDHPFGGDRVGGFTAGYGHLRYFATLSAGLDTHVFTGSKNPVSDKEKKQNRVEELKQVLDIFSDDSISRYSLYDTVKNRKYIQAKLKEKYPSLTVHSWDSRDIRDSEEFQIWSLRIEISNVNEMFPNSESN